MTSILRKNQRKAVAKTLTWRLVSSVALFVMAFIYTESVSSATSFTLIDAGIKTFLYYMHELAWQGKLKDKGYQEPV